MSKINIECKICNNIFTVEYKSGRRPFTCSEKCKMEYRRKFAKVYYKQNSLHKKEYSKLYYALHRDEVLERNSVYSANNRDKINTRVRKNYHANKGGNNDL